MKDLIIEVIIFIDNIVYNYIFISIDKKKNRAL